MRRVTNRGRLTLAMLVMCISVRAVAADGRRAAKDLKPQPTNGIERPEPPAKRRTPWLPTVIRRLIGALDEGIVPDIPHP